MMGEAVSRQRYMRNGHDEGAAHVEADVIPRIAGFNPQSAL
jgi:hypothetical protein